MTERLFLDSIGYGNELKYGYLTSGGGSEKPPHEQAPVLDIQRAVYKPFIEKTPHKQAPLFWPPKRGWRTALSIDFQGWNAHI